MGYLEEEQNWIVGENKCKGIEGQLQVVRIKVKWNDVSEKKVQLQGNGRTQQVKWGKREAS